MKLKPIPNPQKGEVALGTHPELRPQEDTWRRRLNLFPGRSLDELDLTSEQDGRAGRLRLAAATLTPGVVTGLEAELELRAPDRWVITVTPGFGISATGEDVIAREVLSLSLDDIIVFEGGQVGSNPFSTFRAANPDAPRVGILVLQPAEIAEIAGFDPLDQCLLDPCDSGIPNAAFDDQRRVDAGRAVFVPWPANLPAPPAPAVSDLRNRLAYLVFRTEQQLGRGHLLPWETVGLPVGLIGFDPQWRPLFLDRHSVVRQGGKSRHDPLTPGSGTRGLWQARVLQFAEHLADPALSGRSTAELAAQFAFLPPFGVLPRDVIDIPGRRFDFFTSSCEVEARPLPSDQLDAAMKESAFLAPIQRTEETQIQILVPVPPEVYEPRLLIREELDPAFQVKLDGFIQRRAVELRRRRDLRDQANAINRALNGSNLFDLDAADPGAIEPNEALAPFPIDDHQGDYRFAFRTDENGVPLLNDSGAPQIFIQRIETLRTALNAMPPIRTELPELDNLGLRGFIDILKRKADAADDTITFGFLRVQADVFRIQKLILGKQVTSRLTTSPSLSFLQNLEDGDIDEKIRDFVSTLPGRSGGLSPEPQSPRLSLSDQPSAPARSITGEGGGSVSFATPLISTARIGGVQLPAAREPLIPLAVVTRQPQVEVAVAVRETATITPEIFQPPITTAPPVVVTPPVWGARSELTNVTVTERIQVPNAEQARNFTVGARATVVDELAGLSINLDGIQAPGVVQNEATLTLDQVRDRRPEIQTAILRGDFDTLPENAGVDETAFFTAGVRALDQTIATLRGVEGRIQMYRNAIRLCEAAIPDVTAVAGRLNVRLRTVEVSIAEARQDVAVARMLMAEEKDRLRGINDRRARVLAEHVRFVAFRRSRHSNIYFQSPTRALDPGLVESPVPACLGRNAALPAEIQQMVDLLRDAPSRWFVQIPVFLGRIDRLETLAATLSKANERAVSRVAVRKAPDVVPTVAATAPKAVLSAFGAQERVLLEQRAITTQFSSAALTSWTAARELSLDLVAVGDLIDGPHGKPDISRESSRELDNIARISGCLYQEFGDVEPAIRLEWAERLSQFDDPIPLRDLGALPRWGDIPVLDRKEMQKLVDYLFSRINATQQPAVNFMNDLVRVCLLVASYAPVNRIIAAEVVRPTKVNPGGRVDLTVNIAETRIGMQVLLFNGVQPVAEAVVDDLVGSQAVTRVTKVLLPDQTLAAGARAQLFTRKIL